VLDPASSPVSVELEGDESRDVRSLLAELRLLAGTVYVNVLIYSLHSSTMVEADREVWESVARWLELTGLTKTLWRSREPKPLSRAFASRNTRYIASALERLRAAGLVRGAVAGGTRYVYLTERACGLLALLDYSI